MKMPLPMMALTMIPTPSHIEITLFSWTSSSLPPLASFLYRNICC
jgi:hypothetical protein